MNSLFDFSDQPNLTTEQNEIVSSISNGESICVNSVAGSGKTTTLRSTFNTIKNPFLTLAFNVKIKNDLEKIVPDNGTALTINGLGHRIWSKHMGKNLVPAGDKLYKLAKELRIPSQDVGVVVSLVSSAKNAGIVPDTDKSLRQPGLLKNTSINWTHLTSETVADYHVNYAKKLLEESVKTAKKGWIDFDDQVYMPVFYGSLFDRFNTILVDEGQDLSPLNHHLLKKIIRENGQMSVVGDKNQSIYAFRGADSDSMTNLTSMFNLKQMDMTYCFRCGKDIIKEAQKLVPKIRAHVSNPLGKVFRQEMEWSGLLNGTAFLARTNAEVANIASKLMACGYPVNVLGKEISGNIIALVDNISPSNCSIDDLKKKVGDWFRKEESKAIFLKQSEKIEDLRDKADSILVLCDGVADKNELLAKIKETFQAKKDGIVVSTIHRAKGLEWSRVYIVNPSFVGRFGGDDPVKKQQEYNLKYVAITRAINELHFVYI